jgi:predicted peptidase
MKQLLILIVLTILTVPVMAQQNEKKADISGEISYLISTPKDYSDAGKASPLLLFLHGAGERGTDLNKVKAWGPPKIIENGGDLPFIVVSPQCPKGEFWNSFLLKGLLDEVIEKYNVDKSRIYLTGLSMGGYGSFALAMAYPDYFAAVAPVCGGGNTSMAFRMKDIPTWVFHGKLDKSVPYERSVEMVDALKELGANPLFTTLDKGSHVDAWVYAYNEAGLWEWFVKHKK